ncbi:MAG TPA: tetratricopeptide repeat protein, partial [Planctomycetaceae bacterium]|nr:tetratricopeptide repeat protein [Planctomycetaceae bacterium]
MAAFCGPTAAIGRALLPARPGSWWPQAVPPGGALRLRWSLRFGRARGRWLIAVASDRSTGGVERTNQRCPIPGPTRLLDSVRQQSCRAEHSSSWQEFLNMCRRIVLLAGGLALVGASWLWAQENVLSQMYGLGVHAYFSGNYEEAYEHFSQAIEGGSTDPRCYYFRGLCYRRLGREEEAEMDFQKAAAFEARDSAKFYAVSVALQRVQGSERMVIEKHRAEARLAALKRQLQMQRARYEQLQEAESRVLSQQFPVPGGAPAPGAEQAAPAEAPGRATDAFPGTEPAEGAPSPFGEMPGAPGQAAPSEPAEAEPAEAEPAEAEAAEPAQPETPAEPAEAAPAKPEQPVGPFGQPVPSPFETQPPTA